MIVKINTHPIVSETHEEYCIKWEGKIIETKPKLKNGKPIFFIRSSRGCIELNTIDMEYIERTAKSLTYPRGRDSITSDEAYIYIIEENDKKTLLGIVTHKHIKEYKQMYDEFEYIQ